MTSSHPHNYCSGFILKDSFVAQLLHERSMRLLSQRSYLRGDGGRSQHAGEGRVGEVASPIIALGPWGPLVTSEKPREESLVT